MFFNRRTKGACTGKFTEEKYLLKKREKDQTNKMN